MGQDQVSRLLRDHLHGTGKARLRVWSLIVTILGDAVELRGGVVQTARLTALLHAMGVSLAAQRTALSRLVADGWIHRLQDPRDRRASSYRFSETGRAAFVPAARLVYAGPGTVTSGAWLVAQSDDPRGIPIAPGVGMWPADFAPRVWTFSFLGGPVDVPPAMRKIPADQARDSAALEAFLADLAAAPAPDAGLDAMALRIALIHQWRRYVLRHPERPETCAPEGWSGLGLRGGVAEAYHRLRPLSDLWLGADGPVFEALPAPDPEHFARFTERHGDRK